MPGSPLVRVGLHHDPAHAVHAVPHHPESPDRIAWILGGLDSAALLDRLHPIPLRVAADAELHLVHELRFVNSLRRLDTSGGGQIDPDTAVLPGSVDAAARAVGGALNAVDLVAAGELDAAFCLDRPPGHHATPTRAMGFCLFNQAAIAARYAQQRHAIGRVAIVDIDVHHGNGTQDAFAADPSVLYCSTHQYPFYPGTGHWREAGAGNIVNVPLPAGSGDAEYTAAFAQVIAPAVARFDPALIVVSAGFDAHAADPLAYMRLSNDGYAALAAAIKSLADDHCAGRMLWILEGGYDPAALATAPAEVLRVLLGDTHPPPPPQPLHPDVAHLLSTYAELHQLPA